MWLHRKRPWHIPEAKLTDEPLFTRFQAERRSRRRFLKQGALAVTQAAIGASLLSCKGAFAQNPNTSGPGKDLPLMEPYEDLLRPGFPAKRNGKYLVERPLTAEKVAASHNNFYEFSTFKDDVWEKVGDFQPRPWTIEVSGLVEKPFTLDVEELVKLSYEERTYRFRCVEAWAMAVPWTGVPLKKLIERCKPLSSATHVRFVTFFRPEQARGQRNETWWPWPYYEGLKLKEAVHELAFLATGIYGHALPRQHGAPVRLVLPWKYGFKSIKSIAKVEFVRGQPKTFWNDLQPREYDFDGNVNPKVPHPRWSQAREKMIGTGAVHETTWLNGYAELLGELYPRQPVKKGWELARSPF